MSVRFLVNFGLLAIPIGATLGILLGLQSHRAATGQAPLFVDNSVTKTQYCQKAYGIHPQSLGEEYTRKSTLDRPFSSVVATQLHILTCLSLLQ